MLGKVATRKGQIKIKKKGDNGVRFLGVQRLGESFSLDPRV